MTPVRRPRLFHDHKAPLAAFVLVVLTSMFMMVHLARSEATPTWLRHGVSTIAAGPVLVQRVIAGDLVERDAQPADAPADLAVAVPPVETPSASSAPRTPSAPLTHGPTHGPSLGTKHEPTRVPDHAGHVGQPIVAVEPSETPAPPAPPSTPEGSGKDQGHGLVWGGGHDDDSDPSASGSDDESDSDDSSGDDDSHGHGWGHDNGHGWGHDNDDSESDDDSDGHGWGHGNGNGHGWGHGNGNGHAWGHGNDDEGDDSDDDHGWGHGNDDSDSHGGGWGHHR